MLMWNYSQLWIETTVLVKRHGEQGRYDTEGKAELARQIPDDEFRLEMTHRRDQIQETRHRATKCQYCSMETEQMGYQKSCRHFRDRVVKECCESKHRDQHQESMNRKEWLVEQPAKGHHDVVIWKLPLSLVMLSLQTLCDRTLSLQLTQKRGS
mmetsp:Transcript_30202/g.56059  ORF Transcript_30202/g.56059 Transcript_30202/m.56059 type:complete len:154 (-) Transcript_30202:82-543(-)